MDTKPRNKVASKDMISQFRQKKTAEQLEEIVGRYPVFKDEPTGVISGDKENIEEDLDEECNRVRKKINMPVDITSDDEIAKKVKNT